MEAQERATAIGLLFAGEGRDKPITAETLEGTRQHILLAQREAIEHYKARIETYGNRNPWAREVCARLMEIGDATLYQYE